MSGEQDLIDELRALAGTRGDTFVVEHRGLRIGVHYRSGSSSSLTFTAKYDEVARADHEAIGIPDGMGRYRHSARATSIVAARPLAITLRGEWPRDVAAKAEGINVEFQTGDEEFDRYVYVDSPTTDPEVLAAVLGPKVRKGAMALIVLGFQSVKIDDGGKVEAYRTYFSEQTTEPGRGKSAVEAFAVLLSDLPRITASGGAHPALPVWARGGVLMVSAILAGVVVGPAWCAAAYATNCLARATPVAEDAGNHDTSEREVTFHDGCGAPAGLALVIALVVALAAAMLAPVLTTPVLRGRSDASVRILQVRLAAFWLVFVVTTVVVSAIGFSYAHP